MDKSKVEFLERAWESNAKFNYRTHINASVLTLPEFTWKDTINIVLSLGNYTLLWYSKGGHDEWCVALNFNKETRSWDAGSYCYSLEDALECILKKGN